MDTHGGFLLELDEEEQTEVTTVTHKPGAVTILNGLI